MKLCGCMTCSRPGEHITRDDLVLCGQCWDDYLALVRAYPDGFPPGFDVVSYLGVNNPHHTEFSSLNDD